MKLVLPILDDTDPIYIETVEYVKLICPSWIGDHGSDKLGSNKHELSRNLFRRIFDVY